MTASARSRSNAVESQQTTERLLTPATQAALLGMNALHANLSIWRGLMDAMRENMRRQQDALLQTLLTRSVVRADEGEASAPSQDGYGNGAADFLSPMIAARRAYLRMSGAMVDAQRETLAALMHTGASSGADQPRH